MPDEDVILIACPTGDGRLVAVPHRWTFEVEQLEDRCIMRVRLTPMGGGSNKALDKTVKA